MSSITTEKRRPAGDKQQRDEAAMRRYLSGFGNEQVSEALKGVLPEGQNSPQKPPRGLYAEQISGTPFTAPRALNRRTWLYRIRPSALHPAFRRIDNRLLRSAPFGEVEAPPNRLRWDPLPMPTTTQDFVEGLTTIAGNGDTSGRIGVGVHIYRATAPMRNRVFYDADGELLIVPQQGRIELMTELGVIEAAPGEIAVVPRGVKFRVELPDGKARGYVCENYGALFRLPELGPIGANGLANPRDFLAPTAWFEDRDEKIEVIAKFEGNLWATTFDHSPLDVVAWHGNYVPYKYDLARFNTIGTVSYDHPDPSIFTVLTAPTDTPGTANCDFVIFPPRWMVAEHTFRPPWFHRNVMSVSCPAARRCTTAWRGTAPMRPPSKKPSTPICVRTRSTTPSPSCSKLGWSCARPGSRSRPRRCRAIMIRAGRACQSCSGDDGDGELERDARPRAP